MSIEGLTSPVRDAVVEARGELAGRAELVGSAADVAELVPGLLADGRRYLLVIQNPGEARGTGGFMGYFGTLEADGSRLQLTGSDGPPRPRRCRRCTPPPTTSSGWARFDGLIDLRQANFTPDVPTAAGVITQMTDELGWGHYDGIFFVDPIWMSYMLEATGPVTAPGWNGEITADDVVDVIGRQIPSLPDPARGQRAPGQDRAGGVGRDPDARHVAVGRRHRALAEREGAAPADLVADPAEEALLDRLGASGRDDLGRNPLYVVWSGVGASKMAIFADRSVATDVTLADRRQRHRHHDAHADEHGRSTMPSSLSAVRQRHGLPGGDVRRARERLPAESVTDVPFYEASGPTVTAEEHEFGHPVSAGFISAGAGGSMTWSVTYQVPDAVTETDGVREYRLDYLPQPGFAPIPIDVTIHLPDGSTITEASPGVRADGAEVTYRDAPAVPTAIWVRY